MTEEKNTIIQQFRTYSQICSFQIIPHNEHKICGSLYIRTIPLIIIPFSIGIYPVNFTNTSKIGINGKYTSTIICDKASLQRILSGKVER